MARQLALTGRLVVTGHDEGGRARIVEDVAVQRTVLGEDGLASTFFWGRDDIATFPDDGQRPSIHSPTPPPGGCRFATLTVPAHANGSYHSFIVSALGELASPDEPGFHWTPTLDFIIVTEGRFQLELEDGVKTVLSAGDSAVLNGVFHRWSNVGAEDATLVAAQIGARMR